MMTARELPAPAQPQPAPTFETLLDAHGAEVYRHLRRIAGSAEDAADLHQETFLRAYRAWPRLPADANHRAWLHRIAANVAVDAHRRREARPPLASPPTAGRGGAGMGRHEPPGGREPLDGTSAGHPAAGAASDPPARAEAAELRDAVRAALGDLAPRERTAVVGRVLEGHDYADVAALLDCSEPAARQLVSRGLRRVRTLLAPYLETDR
jgi:RNA polymerase sigma-70 factor (ECF subfamily)